MDYRANHKELVECRACGATLAIDSGHRTATCAYCASPNVVSKPPTTDSPTPVFALPFVLPKEKAVTVARKWKKGRWFAPSAFLKAKVDDVQGAYLPAYLYSARAASTFSAEIGENYTVRETYTGANGKRQSRRRTKTEWRTLQGNHEIYVVDRVVTASKGIGNDELEAIEPFNIDALHRYSPKLVSGWIVEDPTLSADACAELGRAEARARVGQLLSAFMPGDSHRNLQYRSSFHEEDITLVLVPVWVLPVRYAVDKPMVRLLVNGQTGRLHGKQPLSWWKIGGGFALMAASCVLAIGYLAGWFHG